jgi:hypothetical protein
MLLLLPAVAFAEEVRIAVGQSSDAAVSAIKQNSGRDITPGLAIVGPKGEHPLTGICWAFEDYDAIIQLSVRDGTVVHMAYWTKKDFGENLSHRAKTEQNITALKLVTKTRGVTIEKTKEKG